MAVNKCTCIIR